VQESAERNILNLRLPLVLALLQIVNIGKQIDHRVATSSAARWHPAFAYGSDVFVLHLIQTDPLMHRSGNT
jgi:hypothetical protein